MPPAVIAAIATVAAAATTTGVTLYEASNQPGSPKPPSTTSTPLTSTQNAQTTSAVSQQLPTLQALTGGSVSPEYASQFGATQAGVANNPQASGDIQAAINAFYGLAAPGSSGLTASPGGAPSGGAGILDLLSKGQAPNAGPPSGGGTDFVNSLLSSDTFKGLVA